MGPYRGERQRAARMADPTGPVAEMVRQFADPHAFLRELVQNAIDAGASRIDARFELAPGDQATFSVTDDGTGMDRSTIEGPLLTLFNSSKEGVSGAIGRYGVGFVSVFALEPDCVLVNTWRDGTAWLVRVHPDHSYELATDTPSQGSGTRVSLLKALTPQAFAETAALGKDALLRWCRHSPRPIHLTIRAWNAPSEETVRIDRPLGVRAPISVVAEDGDTRVVVGPTAGSEQLGAAGEGDADGTDGADFVGFYNRGLTLLETDSPPAPLRAYRCRILCSRLQHTISRDDVRRDDAYAEAVRFAAEVARERLPVALASGLREEAAAVASGGPEHRYRSLLAAATRGPTSLRKEDIVLPLVDPIDGRPTLCLGDAWRRMRKRPPALFAPASCAITRAHAERGRPVLRCATRGLTALLATLFPPGAFVFAPDAFCVVRALPDAAVNESDLRLCAVVERCLRASGVPVDRVILAEHEGGVVECALPATGSRSGLADLTRLGSWWTGQEGEASLWLCASDERIARARDLARTDTASAGTLLARWLYCRILGALPADLNDAVLAAWQEPLT